MSERPSRSLASVLGKLARSRLDEDAWRGLYLHLWPFVLANSARYLGGVEDFAEDVSQEVMIRLARYCPFEALQDENAFRAYVRAVCRNVARSQIRRMAREESALDDVASNPVDTLAAPSTSNDNFLSREMLGAALDLLDATDRSLLELSLGGFSGREIAEVTGLSRSNVYVRIHRLRKTLRKALQNKQLGNHAASVTGESL